MTEAQRLAALTKRCTACKVDKPWAEFYAKVRWPDGTTRNVQSTCKACAKKSWQRRTKAARERREEGWVQRENKHRRDYHARKRSDPEFLRYRQIKNAESRRRTGRAVGPYRPRRVQDPEAGLTLLPIEPFSDWIGREIRSVAKTLPDGDERGAQTLMADRGGIDARRLYAWRHENKTIALDVLDAFACRYGEPTLLADLYPDLYAFEDTEAA